MNLETLQQQKEAKLAELQALEEQIKEAEMRRPFSPSSGAGYFYMAGDGGIMVDNWYGTEGRPMDTGRHSWGNCFKSLDAANRFHDFLALLSELKTFADEQNGDWKLNNSTNDINYYIGLNAVGTLDVLSVVGNMSSQYTILPHFVSEAAASSAITYFGDRLKLLFEYYNS